MGEKISAEEFRDRYYKYQREYRKRNPEKVKEWNINYYRRKVAKHDSENGKETTDGTYCNK